MTDDPFAYKIQYTASPETQTIMWREGFDLKSPTVVTVIYDFRELKMRDALIELGWTPPADNSN